MIGETVDFRKTYAYFCIIFSCHNGMSRFPFSLFPNIPGLDFLRYLKLLFRQDRKAKAWHHTKARRDALESTNAPNVNESGWAAIAGPTWVKIATSAESVSTHTNRWHLVNAVVLNWGYTYPLRVRRTKSFRDAGLENLNQLLTDYG